MGLTDEKYPALMFSFSRNSPLDLMTPEYGCCLLKKNISFHSDVLPMVLLFCFSILLSYLLQGKVSTSGFKQKKIINIARALVLGLLYGTCASNPLLISTVGCFSSSSQKSKLPFLLNGFRRSGIIQLSYPLA